MDERSGSPRVPLGFIPSTEKELIKFKNIALLGPSLPEPWGSLFNEPLFMPPTC